MAAMETPLAGDELDELIAGEIARDPEFADVLDAAIRARELVRRLADLRIRSGLTQACIAERIGTSQSAIARLEAGDSDPRLSTVERYAEAVGVTLDTRPRQPA